MTEKHERIEQLDGLRGVAVLLVVFWHYVANGLADVLPYEDDLAWLPLINRGWVGVELFFLISGYVIFMTLERCSGFLDFMRKRWLRLFPSMLVASVLLLCLSPYFPDHFGSSHAGAMDLLPGLTFVSPSIYNAIFDSELHSLDHVFWTLYVEAAFYIAAGIMYFLFGWQRSIAGLLILWMMGYFLPTLLPQLLDGPLSRLAEPLSWLGFQFFGWFASGSLFYKAKKDSSGKMFVMALVVGCVSAMTLTSGVPIDSMSRILLLSCVILFALAQNVGSVQRVLKSFPLLFLGKISYQLYLCHNFIGVTLIVALGSVVSPMMFYTLPLIAFMVMLFVAWLMERIEPQLRSLLRRLVTNRPIPHGL